MADSNIEQLLKQILDTKLGKDMRQAIHDGIEQCYEDGKVGAVDLVARQRINNLSKLEPGSTTGDAELRDIRIGYDGTEYETAGEAVRGQIGSLSEEIDGINGTKTTFKNNFFIDYNTGNASDLSSRPNYISCSDFISVCYGMKVLLKNVNEYNGVDLRGLAFYDENKNFMSGFQYNGREDIEIEVPKNSYYFRFTITNDKLTSYVLYFSEFPKSINHAIIGIKIEEYIINLTSFRDGRYINYEDGHMGVTNDSYAATDFIPVNGSEIIDIIGAFLLDGYKNYAGVAFYDSGKKYISGWQIDGANSGVSLNVPNNAYFCRITVRTTKKYSAKICMKKYSMQLAYSYKYSRTKLSNKIIVNDGDSITYGQAIDIDEYTGLRPTYGAITALTNGAEFINRAISGTTISDVNVNGKSYNGWVANSDRYNIPYIADYFTMMFGWNDDYYGPIMKREEWLKKTYGKTIYYPITDDKIGTPGYATQEQKNACDSASGIVNGSTYEGLSYYRELFLGSIDSSDKSTFYGAYNFAMNHLLSHYTKTKIGIIVPYGCTTKIRQAVRDISSKYKVPCLDLYDTKYPLIYGKEESAAGLTDTMLKNNRDTFLADGIHPNNLGYERLASIYDGWIKTL